MIRLIALVLALLPAVSLAQVANYRGKTYTPESFPRAQWCSCGMCENIRAQWASRPVAQGILPAAQNLSSTPMQQVTRQVTKYRTVKQCVNGVCTLVQVPYLETVVEWVQVPTTSKPAVAEKTPKPAPKEDAYTPHDVAKAMITELAPQLDEKFFDLGCGDGRLLIEAAKYGADVYGVEIEPEVAKSARSSLDRAGVNGKIIVADATKFDASAASCVALYLYPDQLEEIVSKLKPGTRIASYAHAIPGQMNTRHTVGKHEFFTAVVDPLSTLQ